MLSTSVVEFETRFSTRVLPDSSRSDLSRSDLSRRRLNYDRLDSIIFSGSCILPVSSQQVVPSKFYAIRRRIVLGIYCSWSNCKDYVLNFPRARYKNFRTMAEVERFMLLDD